MMGEVIEEKKWKLHESAPKHGRPELTRELS